MSVGSQFEHTDGAVLLPERWTPDIKHISHPLQVDRSVNAQVRPRALGQIAGEFDIDRYRSVLHRRIDSHYRARDHAVVSIDRSELSNLHVARLRLGDLQYGHQV